MSTQIVTAKNVTKVYKQNLGHPDSSSFLKRIFAKPQTKDINAVNNVSFSIEKGESIAFIGPNGSGKSTTIKLLTGVLHADSGEIEILGLDPSKDRLKLTQKIGCVFGQKSNLFYHIPALETFELLARIYDCDLVRARKRIQDLIELFDLSSFMSNPVRKLSLGQRMKCEIVASLIHEPEIIFLDEPTIGLDIIAKQQIREELIRLNKQEGITVFLTSHDALDVDQIADRTIVINHGELLYDGNTIDLKSHYVKAERVEVVSEPSMEDIITEIYRDAHRGDRVGGENQAR